MRLKHVCLVVSTTIQLTAISTPAALPWLHVEGNKIKDPQGNTVILRGVSLIDIGAALGQYGNITEMIGKLTGGTDGWHAKIIRLPVYPPQVESYQTCCPFPFNPSGNDDYLNNRLKPIVDYCTSNDLYAIIDFHQIDNTTGEHDTQAKQFWEYMAPKFKDYSNVLYEVFNEPIDDISQDAASRWNDYRPRAQAWVDIVRSQAPDNLVLVGGPIWSQNIGPAADNPVQGTNIVYVGHTYPVNWNSWLQGQFSTCADKYPVILTEWGFGKETDFADQVKTFVEQRGLSWTAWCVSYNWGPPMFNNDWSPNQFGNFVKTWLTEKKDSDLPSVSGSEGPFTLTVLTSGTGTVTVDPQQSEYPAGTQVTLSASAGPGHAFSGWSGSLEGSANPATITMNGNKTITATFAAAGELVTNGDFSAGTQSWGPLGVWTENAQAGGSVVDGAYVIAITNGDTADWSVQLTQTGIALEQGVSYVLRFDAWSPEGPRSIKVNIGEGREPWTSYLGKDVQITAEKQPFSFVFTMTGPSNPGARLEFNCGKSDLDVTLDNISLKSGTEAQVVPASHPVKLLRPVTGPNLMCPGHYGTNGRLIGTGSTGVPGVRIRQELTGQKVEIVVGRRQTRR
jgi:hypothetical protein